MLAWPAQAARPYLATWPEGRSASSRTAGFREGAAALATSALVQRLHTLRRRRLKRSAFLVRAWAQPPRRVFASREVEMDGVQVVGYDLDYTLVHYRLKAWEGKVYAQCKEILRKQGFDVEGLNFDPELVIRGLVIDSKLGNIVKVDRYGYVRK
ncbi:unnamed protein product, partial [Effrenium voratum]